MSPSLHARVNVRLVTPTLSSQRTHSTHLMAPLLSASRRPQFASVRGPETAGPPEVSRPGPQRIVWTLVSILAFQTRALRVMEAVLPFAAPL